jgi:general secretion pathway protein N
LPARVSVNWFAPDNLLISGVSGTVWTGSASEASLDGIYLSDVKWRLKASGFFTGHLSYRVEATTASGVLASDLAVSFSGALSMTELEALLELDPFADLIGVPGMTGAASLSFVRLEIVDGLATFADGTVDISNLVVPILGRESMGGYSAKFTTQNNGVVANIDEAADGVIDIMDGFLRIKADRSFEFIAQVMPNARTPQRIRQQLQYLPSGDKDGQKELRLEGIL